MSSKHKSSPDKHQADASDTGDNAASSGAGSTGTNVVALPQPGPQPATASQKAVAFVREHPVLTIAGGVAIGLAVSALVPRSFSRRLAGRAWRFAEAGASAALALGHETLDKAEDAGGVARRKAGLLASQAERLGERAIAKAERVGVAALGTAGGLGHAAAARAERLGHVAADRAEVLGERASERLSELGNKALARSSRLFGYPEPSQGVADRVRGKAQEWTARIRH